MKLLQKFVSLFSAAAMLSTAVSLGARAEVSGSENDAPEVITLVADGDASEYGYVHYKYIDENGNEVTPNLTPTGTLAYHGTLPSKYSMVDRGYLPAVRNQGSEGSCWAHAGMAMAESSMIKQGYASASSVDYSEKHLAWFAVGATAPQGDSLYGDFSGLGAPTAYSAGGNMVDIMFTMMSWIGAEEESNVPYADFNSGVDESYRYHSYAHLQNVNLYDEKDINSIKEAIMRDGAVQISYYASSNYLTKNSGEYTAYYCPNGYTSNHSITVVGWDDNFSKSNFRTGGTPNNDGAWLCRNSWGSTWGTSGYFYLSYNDATVGEFASLTMEPTTNYGSIYQYDGGCLRQNGYIYSTSRVSHTNIGGGANVFTADKNDEITAVSFYSAEAGWNYTINVYTGLTGSTPDTGTLAKSAVISGTQEYAGYHTVDLPVSVPVKAGEKFAVAVDLYDKNGKHYVITDRYSPSTGLSFYKFYNTWSDCTTKYKSNVRIKAYTKAVKTTVPQNVTASAGDNTVKLTWDKVDGATNYVIYSYADNTYTKLGYSTTNSFTASDLINGKKYGFIVRSYVSGKWSDWSNDDAVYATPKASANKPQNVKAVPGDKQVTITWNAVNGATNYIVYSYVDGSYHNLGTTTSTSFTAKNLVNGKKYGFIVKAWVNGKWNNWSVADAVYATPVQNTKPQNVQAVPGNGQVTLTWDAVENAEEYVVYSYVDGGYHKLGYSDVNSFTATGLTNGKKYGFIVKAWVNGGWNAWSNDDAVYATPVGGTDVRNVKAVPGNGQVALTWNKVSGATNYVIYSYADGKYTKQGYSDTTSFTVTGLTNGKEYGFIVRSYANGTWCGWQPSDATFATPVNTKPQNVHAVPGNGQVTLTWDAVENAEDYVVYSYVDGGYNKLGYSKTNSFTATGLTNGKKYGFIVKAWVNGGWNAWSNDDAVYATPVGGTDVRNVKAVPGNGQVALTWDKVSGATNYVIYSYADGKYTKQGYSDTTSFTVTGLTNGKEYGFIVRSYANGTWCGWQPSDAIFATPVNAKPQNVQAMAGDKEVHLIWDDVDGAEEYVIYSYVDGNYAKLGYSEYSGYTAEGLTNGRKYGFIVKAWVNGRWNDWSNDDAVYAEPVGAFDKPLNIKAAAGNQEVYLTWGEVDGAEMYVVYIYADGKYTKLGYTEDTGYTAEGLTNGKKYGFIVRSYLDGQWCGWSPADLVYSTPRA